jgi:hypothetical protein
MDCWQRIIILLFISGIVVGCSSSSPSASRTLSLTLTDKREGLEITDYSVTEQPFQKSQQQGLYQAHLIDKSGNILQRISFEKLNIPSSESKKGDNSFYVALPLLKNTDQITIYQLDGSSGHFQLKGEDPLLRWTLPEDIAMEEQ